MGVFPLAHVAIVRGLLAPGGGARGLGDRAVVLSRASGGTFQMVRTATVSAVGGAMSIAVGAGGSCPNRRRRQITQHSNYAAERWRFVSLRQQSSRQADDGRALPGGKSSCSTFALIPPLANGSGGYTQFRSRIGTRPRISGKPSSSTQDWRWRSRGVGSGLDEPEAGEPQRWAITCGRQRRPTGSSPC